MNANSRDVNHCQCERLAPALNRLLESCIEIKTTNTKILAEYLCRSPATIRTQFQRILILMDGFGADADHPLVLGLPIRNSTVKYSESNKKR